MCYFLDNFLPSVLSFCLEFLLIQCVLPPGLIFWLYPVLFCVLSPWLFVLISSFFNLIIWPFISLHFWYFQELFLLWMSFWGDSYLVELGWVRDLTPLTNSELTPWFPTTSSKSLPPTPDTPVPSNPLCHRVAGFLVAPPLHSFLPLCFLSACWIAYSSISSFHNLDISCVLCVSSPIFMSS